jgi:hypothetical protein
MAITKVRFLQRHTGLSKRHADRQWLALDCLPEGNLSVLLGRHGEMNPAGKVRYNVFTIKTPHFCLGSSRHHALGKGGMSLANL